MLVSKIMVYSWLRHYLLAELVGLAVAVVSITLANHMTNNVLLLMAVSLYSGTIGYYSVLSLHALCAEQPIQLVAARPRAHSHVISTVRTLLFELGSAELLDSLLISPLLLYGCLHLLPNQQLAVVLSELISTLAFYATVVVVQYWRQPEMCSTDSYLFLEKKKK